MDDRFEVSFHNPIVRMWFYVMLPTIIASIILFFILPLEYHLTVRTAGSFIMVTFTIWVFIFKRKSKNSRGEK